MHQGLIYDYIRELVVLLELHPMTYAHISHPPALTLSPGSVVLLDVDDTLITPVSAFFHTDPYMKVLDSLKAEHHPELPHILGNWRLQRRVQLVDPSWPQWIADLQQKGVLVLALTQLHSRTYGPIASMEQWRHDELATMGLHFSDPLSSSEPLTLLSSTEGEATYYKGILITGPFSKAQTFGAFLAHIDRPTHVTFMDDRESHLKVMDAWCLAHHIPFEGYHFKGLERFTQKADPRVAAFQQEHLLTQHTWVEDEEAHAIVSRL